MPEISKQPKFPAEQQMVTFSAGFEWARLHHKSTWLWSAACVTYRLSFHLPGSPSAWDASSSAAAGGTRDLQGSREHFLISVGHSFPA